MVRHELATALASPGVVIVPTLVEGAEVPACDALPAELRPLFDTWNARRVTEDGWEDDTRRLVAEIAEATGLPVQRDLDALLRDAGAAQQRMAELEQARHLQAGQIEALRRTVEDLTGRLAEASGAAQRAGLAAAFAALAQGDTGAAETLFEREYEAQQRAADDARRTMAEAARNVANLALLHDVDQGGRLLPQGARRRPDARRDGAAARHGADRAGRPCGGTRGADGGAAPRRRGRRHAGRDGGTGRAGRCPDGDGASGRRRRGVPGRPAHRGSALGCRPG